jgi:hypothetical protein
MKHPVLVLSVQATAAVTAGRAVSFAGGVASAAKALGVAETSVAAGQWFGATVIGVTDMEAGGPVAPGDLVAPDATGRGVKTADTGIAIGEARSAAAAAGDSFEILIR